MLTAWYFGLFWLLTSMALDASKHLVCASAYHAFLRGLSALPVPPSYSVSAGDSSIDALFINNSGAGRSGSCTATATNTDRAPRGSHCESGESRHVAGDGQSSKSCGRGHDRVKTHLASGHVTLVPSPEQHLYDTRALLRLIWLLHGHALWRALALIYCYQVFVFFQPVLLNELTNQLAHGRPADKRIWILPALLFLSPLLGSLCKAQAQLIMIQIQIALRSQLTAAVYRKCLRLSAGARASLPSGRVVNLMSADVAKICDFLYPQLTFISVAPLAVVVSLIMLWFKIGWGTLVGLAVLLLSSPVSNMAVRATQRHRNEMLKASDSRMKLVGQFLAGVRVIKMYHWEQPQAESITKCRAEELRALRNMIPSKVAMQTLLYVLPQLAGVLSFVAVGLTNPQALTAGRVFSSLVLFQIMRFPLLTLSTGLVELGAAIISARRITSFMAAEEQRDYVTRLTQPPGTTPLPPPSARRRSSSTYEKRNGDCLTPALQRDLSLHRTSEGGMPSLATGGGGRGINTFDNSSGCDGSANEAIATPVAVVAATTSAPTNAFASGSGGNGGSSGLQMSAMARLSRSSQAGQLPLQGVEPGLTIRAAGFRWAPIMPPQQHQEDQERLGKDTVGGPASGAGGGASNAHQGRSLLSFRRCGSRSKPRPFMETGRRDVNMECVTSSSTLSHPGGSAGGLVGTTAVGLVTGNMPGLSVGWRKEADEERTGLLRGAGRDGNGFALGQVDLRVRPGELVCVVGRVGSGKSSLLSAALGEMELVEELDQERGDVVGLGGRVAYVAQQAWIVNATVVENVTMGKPFDEEKWARCVEASALGPDLELLPAGRDTEIGEKGVNLSGGQKQRLSLARAMYQEADIYLLDDPLSAVDVHVGGHIFKHMIRGAQAGAAVLLVTNGVQYLPPADSIVLMDAGEIVMQGTYQQCMGEPAFRSLLEEFRTEQQQPQQGEVQGEGRQQEEQQQDPDVFAGANRCSSVLVVSSGPDMGRVQPRGINRTEAGPQAGSVAESGGSDHQPKSKQGHPQDPHHDGQQCKEGLQYSPTGISYSMSTAAYNARRTSVEQSQRQWHGNYLTSHMADFDEGNEMMDSLLRMSVDGGRESDSESSCNGDGIKAHSGAGAVAALVDHGTGAGVGSGGGANGVDRPEESRPLLSTCQTVCSSNSTTRDTTDAGACCSDATVLRHGDNIAAGQGMPAGCLKAGSPSPSPRLPPAVISQHGATAATAKGRITVVEDRELGQVKWKVYGAYLRAFHVAAAVAILLFWSAEQGTRLATNAWLAHWSRDQQQQQQQSALSAPGKGGPGFSRFAGVYLLLGAAYAFATFCRSTTNNLGSYRASKILHAQTLTALMAAPLSFFEATPVGRILNRLSRDVDEMDYNLAMYQQQLGNCVMRLLATILFLCILQPAFVGVVVPLTVIYFILQKYFRRSSIELQRIDSVTRSPVYANFAETMAGLDTLRAYRMQERFKARHEAMVDTNATAYYNARVADEWLSLRLDLIGSIIVLSVAALNVGLQSISSISPALVALALAEAIDLTSFLNYAVKVSALVESRYNAVERLLTYARLEPEEAVQAGAAKHSPYRPPGLPPWPATGELEFRDIWMSYRPSLDPVLQGVTFKVYDGQKVGIVGRTGSGKSSLIVALFRLVEPQRGQMLLDGVDLRTLGLGAARSALSAIPQEPVLFSGSVR
ncbi:ABC transporter, partial [Volvox carteri f. nagariensis]